MKIVVFGLTISSSWGNGHATLWRGLCRALARRGHRVVFFEHDVPYYAGTRDLFEVPGGALVLYADWGAIRHRARAELADADVAMVTSYCPHGIEATELVLDARGTRVFYDLDTPVTLSRLKAEQIAVRFGAAAIGGALIAAFYALAWPHCLGRLEGVSDELHRLWLSRVREALPIYKHDRGVIAAVLTLPAFGLIGYGAAVWRNRRDAEQLAPWVILGLLSFIATALLFWQTRAGPAAQMLAIPGAAALTWLAIAWGQRQAALIVRVAVTVVSFFVISGLAVQNIVGLIPKEEKPNQAVAQANNKCPTLAGLRPIALQKPGYVFTHVDLGPRLITVTHHKAVAGPYHRNQQGILDVMKGFRGSVENAREIITRRGIDYVLICPGLSETTIYSAEAPNGFYKQLIAGKVPAWLQPVQLPRDWPYKMWRVVK